MKQLLIDGNLEFEPDLLKCTSFAVGELVFDNENGVGSVPNLADILWKGALVTMTPRMFLSLTPFLELDERPKTHQFLQSNERPLGSPFLIIKHSTETDDLAAWGHEGRHRMMWIAKNYGFDIEIPIGLFVLEDYYTLKAREMEPQIMERIAMGVKREKSTEFVEGPIFTKAVWSHGSIGLKSHVEDIPSNTPQSPVGA